MIDESASAAAGLELESTVFVRDLQRPAVDGPAISDEAADGLYRVLTGNAALVPGRVMRELTAAGFLDRQERPTAETLALVPHWEYPVLELTARGSRTGTVSVWGAGAMAVVSASADELGKRHLGGVPLNRVPAQLSAWLGVAPHWTFSDGRPATITRGEYEAALARTDAPVPQSAGPHLARAWRHPWTEYLIQTRVHRYRFVATNDSWLVVRADGEASVTLDALPPIELFTTLITLFTESVHSVART